MSLNMSVAIFFSLFVISCCLFTLGQFVVFLSSHKSLQLGSVQNGYFEQVELQVSWDLLLLCFFSLQHSLQCSQAVKDALSWLGWDPYERLLYNLGSCISLQVLMRFWHPVPSWVVWEVPQSAAMWWLFTAIHTVAWLLMYSMCFVMDLTEMLGVKQVVYALQGNPPPLSLKSDSLRRLYAHMRHPGLTCLGVVLVAHPLVQLDRLLLAHGLVGYAVLRAGVDPADYAYQLRVTRKKEKGL